MKYIRRVDLADQYLPTGKTRHFVGSEKAPIPTQLAIAQFEGEEGFYLLYLDSDGNEIADTFHESLESALDQATWEFAVPASAWKPVDFN